MADWTSKDIPSQTGRVAVVTGTGGLGLATAQDLARAGARVIVAGRSAAKGAAAVAQIMAAAPTADVRFEVLDLGNLASVAAFSQRTSAQESRLDILVNNAGIMTPPKRLATSDGFEVQFGTNHLGHFALTAGLLPLLRTTAGARVISLSSIVARGGKLNFADMNWEGSYNAMQAYGQSKLACLMFALELQRRSVAGGWGISSIAAHPGIARTDLINNGMGAASAGGLVRKYMAFLFQPVEMGALPILYAATAPQAQAGGYYGPNKLSEMRGYPTAAKIPPQAQVLADAARLWDISAQMTKVNFA